MSTPHVLDELSAYIDGESPDPQRIARHLQSCPACARRHVELSKLAHHVQAVRGPDVSPDFSARIVAALEETRPFPRWYQPFLFQRVVSTGWALAAVLLVAGSAYVVIQHVESQSTTPSAHKASPVATEPDPEAIARILDAGMWEGPFEEEDGEGGDLVEAFSVDMLMDALAVNAGEADVDGWYEEDDLVTVLEVLAQEDVQVLSELAQNLWDEG